MSFLMIIGIFKDNYHCIVLPFRFFSFSVQYCMKGI
uniref:Uncharacterized protein n=1 Tax=Anguilla anguilla TaxID=7936 RepID=A0A0E9R0T0_ANGAN